MKGKEDRIDWKLKRMKQGGENATVMVHQDRSSQKEHRISLFFYFHTLRHEQGGSL